METHADRPLRRFTVDEVLRMVEVGVIDADEPVELLDGLVSVVSPQGPLHASLTTRLRDVLAAGLVDAHVRERKPVVCGDYSLPEPDLMIVAGGALDYLQGHPAAADTRLIVEMAFSSQRVDRHKAAIYAASLAPVYWIVDVVEHTITVHEHPMDGRYRGVQIQEGCDAVVQPVTGVGWTVDEILGAPSGA